MTNERKSNTVRVGRRRFIVSAGTAAAALWMSGGVKALAATPGGEPRYRIGVCDWMILKRQKLGAFGKASQIGADGVEVDMGGLGNRPSFDDKLTDRAVRRTFRDTAAADGLEICSLAMSAFYAQSFSARDGVIDMVKGCIDIMKDMGVKVAFLPLGVQDDLVSHPEVRPAVIKRLRELAPYAEKAGVIIGIETALDAAGEVKLLEEIGSKAVQSYFNFENPVQNGRDLCSELKILGRERICQIHCTDSDGVWLENDPLIDMKKVRRTLDDMGWRGWLVMERSRDASDPHNDIKNYGANARFLKKMFQQGRG
jgi:sugar phosphate isomerase/epimerase